MNGHISPDDSTPQNDKSVPIAIVGYACRFPGDATSPTAFYEMLAKGRSAWSEVPANRYNVDAYWHPSADRIGTTTARGASINKGACGRELNHGYSLITS